MNFTNINHSLKSDGEIVILPNNYFINSPKQLYYLSFKEFDMKSFLIFNEYFIRKKLDINLVMFLCFKSSLRSINKNNKKYKKIYKEFKKIRTLNFSIFDNATNFDIVDFFNNID